MNTYFIRLNEIEEKMREIAVKVAQGALRDAGAGFNAQDLKF
jgi:hypothetical protein